MASRTARGGLLCNPNTHLSFSPFYQDSQLLAPQASEAIVCVPNGVACKCHRSYLYCDLSESHVGLLAAVGAVRPKGQPILRLSIGSVRP
jgi:hypothetical protein